MAVGVEGLALCADVPAGDPPDRRGVRAIGQLGDPSDLEAAVGQGVLRDHDGDPRVARDA